MLSSLLPDHQSCNKLEVTLTDVFPLLQFHFLSSFVVIELLLQNHSSHEKKTWHSLSKSPKMPYLYIQA